MSNEDWRSPAAYDYAAAMEPSGLAWEFLRRNPDYRIAYETAQAGAYDGVEGQAGVGVAIFWPIQTNALTSRPSSGILTNWRRSSS